MRSGRYTLPALLSITFCIATAFAQTEIITTIAGTDFVFPAGGVRAVGAPLRSIGDVVLDPSGNMFLADAGNHFVIKVDREGVARVYAGNGIRGYSGDGELATRASLNEPRGLALDSSSNLFIADQNNDRVRRIDAATGIITTVAGSGERGFAGDGGPARNARFYRPAAVAVDSAGNLFIADQFNNRVRKVDASGVITTVAGTSFAGYNGDERPAVSAALFLPRGLAFNASGQLHIADYYNHRIRRIDARGIISSIAGNGRDEYRGDGGPATAAGIKYPADITFDLQGSLYIAEEASHRVRRVSSSGTISTFAGSGRLGFFGDGDNALQSSLAAPSGLAADSLALYIADSENDRVRKVVNNTISTVAGGGSRAMFRDGIPARAAVLAGARRLAQDHVGYLYLADERARLVRRIEPGPNGLITTIAGNGTFGYTGDGGPATETALSDVRGLAVDAAGDLYIADRSNHRIRRVDRNGIITSFAGQGRPGHADGNAQTEALFASPNGLTFGPDGALYVADEETYTIRRVMNGRVETIAGTPHRRGFGGDNGPGRNAVLNVPYDLCFDPAGNLYIAELEGHRIRMLDRRGMIRTIAGTGVAGYNGDGFDATRAQISFPSGIACGHDGSIYVAEERPPRIRRISAGTISTIAGNGIEGRSGDGGPAVNARFTSPTGLLATESGELYVADDANRKVRLITPNRPTSTVSPSSLMFFVRAGADPESRYLYLSTSIPGVRYSVEVTPAAEWLSVSPASSSTPATLVVTIHPERLTPGEHTAIINVLVPVAVPAVQRVEVRVTAGAPLPPRLEVSPEHTLISASSGQAAVSKQIVVANSGGGDAEFDASLSGPTWLSVQPSSGTVAKGKPVVLTVRAAPGGAVASDMHRGELVITSKSDGQTVRSVITAAVSERPAILEVAPSVLGFRAVSSGADPPPQSIVIANTGTSQMTWKIDSLTNSGGEWLSVSRSSGTVAAGAANSAVVEVRVRSGGLEPARYTGQLLISTDDAANSTEIITVSLDTRSGGTLAEKLEIRPQQLVFVGARGSRPGSQEFVIRNGTDRRVTFTSSANSSPANWIQYIPAAASLEPDQTLTVVAQTDLTALTPGVHQGTISLLFNGERVETLNLLALISEESAANSGGKVASDERFRSSYRLQQTLDPDCKPASLVPLLVEIGSTSRAALSWPTVLRARVLDNCGRPVSAGSLAASFSNNDDSQAFTPAAGGLWTALWVVRNASDAVTITLTAESEDRSLSGSAQSTVEVQAGTPVPVIDDGGVRNTADPSFVGSVAPGALITIRGQRLATSDTAAEPDANGRLAVASLAGTRAQIGGRLLPIFRVSETEIRAVVPFELPANSILPLSVNLAGFGTSSPQRVAIARSQPMIWVTRDEPGAGTQWPIRSSSDSQPVSAENPVKAGETILVFCSGMGQVAPAIDAGLAAPHEPWIRPANDFTVLIGDTPADVVSSRLVPGQAGLYQVEAVVPDGVTGLDSVPVRISTGLQMSNEVRIAVQ